MKDKSSFSLVDTHAHLASSRFSDSRAALISKAKANGVDRIVTIACDLEDSRENLAMAAEFPGVAPTVGVHPTYVHEIGSKNWENEIRELAKSPGVAAIGEIGLDYFHPPQDGSPEKEWRKKQREVFETLLQISIDLDLPAVIHQRESGADVAEVLQQFPKAKAVLHCFGGTKSEAEKALEMGHYISFTGILTFPKAPEVRNVAQMVPLDRVMVETDSPFLAPVPFRGKQCEPAMVRHTAEKLGELHGLSLPEIAAITTENAERFFRSLPSLDSL